jgi:hypothetical protein
MIDLRTHIRDKRLLTDDEFQAHKAKLLSS